MPNPAPTAAPEAYLAQHLAAFLDKTRALLTTVTEDPDTLLQRVIELADVVDELHVAIIDTGEQPLNSAALTENVQALGLDSGPTNMTAFGGDAA